MRARKLLGTLGTTKLYIYNLMNINNKNKKKRYPANTNLLGTDWAPLGTLLFSCTYARNKRAVPTGTHVNICVWVPTNPITMGLTGAVPRVPSVPSVFLYIYSFFWGAGRWRAGGFWINPMQSNSHDNPACPRIMGATKPLPKILTCANWGYIWGYV